MPVSISLSIKARCESPPRGASREVDWPHPATARSLRRRRSGRQPGQRPDDEPDTHQHDHAVAQHRSDDVFAGQLRNAASDPQEQRPVGAGVSRQRLGTESVNTWSSRGRVPPHLVGVETDLGDLALSQIRVDVLAVHRGAIRSGSIHSSSVWSSWLRDMRWLPSADPARASARPVPSSRRRWSSPSVRRSGLRGRLRRRTPERRILHHRSRTSPEGPDAHQYRSGGSEDAVRRIAEFGVVEGNPCARHRAIARSKNSTTGGGLDTCRTLAVAPLTSGG